VTDPDFGLPRSVHAPAIESHRLIGDGRSAALVLPDASIDWWCAPDVDSPPLLWWLLDPTGGIARWRNGRMVGRDDRPAGPTAKTVVVVDGNHLECWDGLIPGADGSGSCLVRLVRCADRAVTVVHELRVGGFDTPRAVWEGTRAPVGDASVHVTGGTSRSHGRSLHTEITTVPGEWVGLAVCVDDRLPRPLSELGVLLAEAEADLEALLAAARLPRHHPERARDALIVLDTCTFAATGAVIAAPTTSLPEVVGGTAQWDYRYTWLRDASLAVSVASLLGQRHTAQRYLAFVNDMTKGRLAPSGPMTDVRGETVPREREVEAAGWAGSKPVRVGNAARDQVQYDALGLLVQSISVYLQTGGSLDRGTWELVRTIADSLADDTHTELDTNGIWELRETLPLVDADIGRWLALDVALWVARLRHPLTRRRHWKAARDAARDRVLGAIRDDGGLPQAYERSSGSDASALMIPVFALLGRKDPRAHRLVDAVRHDLGAGPFLYRFPPQAGDGREGAFLPVSWWAVTALAVLGRYDEAKQLADAMCARLPRLLAEEVDPESGHSLGNTPLVWSHMEAARAMYVLDAARIRARWGPVGLTLWRLVRYAQLRWFTGQSPHDETPPEGRRS